MHILLIEDDSTLRALVRRNLEAAGFAADAAGTIEEAEAALAATSFDAVLLDLMLPDGDGIELLKRLRERRDRTPIIAVTARDGVDDRVAGLNLGADDYVVKPFATEELVARLRAVLRRPPEALAVRLAFANLELDPATGSVAVSGRTVPVPRKELAILEMLMRRAGRVVARALLEQSVYALGEEIGSNAMDANISRLRRRLAEAGAETAIHAVRGVGYMIGAGGERGAA
ncbi:MAG: response regulator transcription factor [Alphaproteobacteria bacterium]|nr:response regulator transcription factor [Alphaproteobacteria bacterium]